MNMSKPINICVGHEQSFVAQNTCTRATARAAHSCSLDSTRFHARIIFEFIQVGYLAMNMYLTEVIPTAKEVDPLVVDLKPYSTPDKAVNDPYFSPVKHEI